MLRIIDGTAFVGRLSSDRWTVCRRDLGSGQVELSARRAVDWVEAEWDPAHARAELIDKLGEAEVVRREAEAAVEREQLNRQRAARRAKTKVRHLSKVQGLDTLMTLTYRANMQDQRRAWADLKAFVRRMRAALGSFAYVAVPERQARGAVHWHLAVHRLPAVMAARNGVKVKAFNVIRAIWRSVVGEDGGNVDVARRRRGRSHSVAKLAAYISKYVTKGFETSEVEANRYSSSLGVRVPPVDRWEARAESLAELLAQVYGDAWPSGSVLVSAWLDEFGEACYFAAAPPGPPDTIMIGAVSSAA